MPRMALDAARAGAIRTALLPGGDAGEDEQLGNWLEALRDRVIVRSQVGKRKLDAAFTRRALDRKLADLGEQLLGLAREGRLAVPGDVAGLFTEARQLKEALEAQHEEIAALESEK